MNKAVFFDRDGTLIEAVHYLNDPDEVVLHEGVAQALRVLQQAGYLLIVVTNQSGIGRGLITQEAYEAVQERMLALFAEEGVTFQAVYHCPHHPAEAKGEYLRHCDWRKPGTGMVDAAVREHDLDRGASFLVGDTATDVAAGKRAGLVSILVRTGHGRGTLESGEPIEADHVADDVQDAVTRYIVPRDG